MKKYELTDETKVFAGVTVHRIRALIDIPRYRVNAGDLGGFIEKESNLSHDGECWIGNNACAYDNACIYGDTQISDNAIVSGEACIYGDACVSGEACIYGDACVSGEALITQGKYHTSAMHITVLPYGVTAIYPNHVQIGCKLFEICDKETAIETMREFNIPQEYHKQIWIAVRLCKQWLKDNPEKGDKPCES